MKPLSNHELRAAPAPCKNDHRELQRLSICVLLIGLHSLCLGAFVYLFTNTFYDLFFGVAVENFFFVQQAGLFLFCLGLFYLVPLADLKSHHRSLDIIIISKLMAVFFLVSSTHLVPRPLTIVLACIGDGLMAGLLIWFSHAAGLLFKASGKSPL
jgi:hypothetical protein